ncbi:hypothetical protein HDU93_007387 [Gonapodya sp. JEL0774]|nr:hypothetical protein HDU93_007387 [Gonapodya sp. JEL0774]
MIGKTTKKLALGEGPTIKSAHSHFNKTFREYKKKKAQAKKDSGEEEPEESQLDALLEDFKQLREGWKEWKDNKKQLQQACKAKDDADSIRACKDSLQRLQDKTTYTQKQDGGESTDPDESLPEGVNNGTGNLNQRTSSTTRRNPASALLDLNKLYMSINESNMEMMKEITGSMANMQEASTSSLDLQ